MDCARSQYEYTRAWLAADGWSQAA
jgi:hypothetical protein